jgi:uncharacterized RDD family membrane protein YckC
MADADKQIRELITPEGVDLRLRLGEGGERAAAFLLDALIMLGVLIAMSLLAFTAAWAAGGRGSRQLIAIVWLLGFFLLRNAYFIGFELTARAATPGKRALGLRVASRNGGRLTADAVFARNFMRELEIYVPMGALIAGLLTRDGDVSGWIYLAALVWSMIFLLFPLFNRDRLRAGDLVAGTWVVKAPKLKLIHDLAEEHTARAPAFQFTQTQIDAYGVHELHVLEDVLRRQDRKTMAAVAQRIRAKIDWVEQGYAHDGDFLSAYYAALRGRLEQQLLFGKRKKDKFDRV